jgi:hypothetical protein
MGCQLRRPAAFGLVLLLVFTNGSSASSQKPVVQHTVDYVKPPSTLEALWRGVDAVILAEVESSAVQRFDLTGHANSPRVATNHNVRVLEVLSRERELGQWVVVSESFKRRANWTSAIES